jgi:hypothetical protein
LYFEQKKSPKMKPTTLARYGVSAQTVALISRLVGSIPWPDRRRAMGDVTASLLDGKPREAESMFGWSRHAVEVGMHETRSGISCINHVSARLKPRTQDKHPDLLADIQAIMEPHSQSDPSLRTILAVHGHDGQDSTRGARAEGMVGAIPSRRAHDLQPAEPATVPSAHGGQNEGSKKTAQTDAIFDNVRRVNARADADPQTLRIKHRHQSHGACG